MVKYLNALSNAMLGSGENICHSYLKGKEVEGYKNATIDFFDDKILFTIYFDNRYGMEVSYKFNFEDFRVNNTSKPTSKYNLDKKWIKFMYDHLKQYRPDLVNSYVNDFYKYRSRLKKELIEKYEEETNSFIEDDLNFFDVQ